MQGQQSPWLCLRHYQLHYSVHLERGTARWEPACCRMDDQPLLHLFLPARAGGIVLVGTQLGQKKPGNVTQRYFQRTMHYSAKFFLSSALYQKGFVRASLELAFELSKIYPRLLWTGNPITAPDISLSLSLRLLTTAAATKNFVAYDSA